MPFCCEEFRRAATGLSAPSYKAMMTVNPPMTEVEFYLADGADMAWNVLGCCRDCYVIQLRYCPFCGKKLPLVWPEDEPKGAAR